MSPVKKKKSRLHVFFHCLLSYQGTPSVDSVANAVAHSLAAYSRSVESSGVLNYSAPACVLKQIVLDCNYDIAV
jgi:hypothetical protein